MIQDKETSGYILAELILMLIGAILYIETGHSEWLLGFSLIALIVFCKSLVTDHGN